MDNKITGNEPAQPSSVCCDANGIYNGSDTSTGGNGLTIRQHFAAMAMQGLLSSNRYAVIEKVSIFSVAQADALIKELNKQQPQQPNNTKI